MRAAVGCLRSPRAPSSVEPRPRSLRAGSPTALLTRYLDARCPGRPATTAAPPSPWQGVPARDASGDAASAPVLVLHNVADPVTELAVARRAAARLPDARVVVHHGSGHRVRAVAGPCLRALVDRFLLDGRLPEGTGTGCRGASVAS